MRTKLALASLVLVGLCSCAGAPQWDATQFPPQPMYSGAAELPTTASTTK